MNAFPFCQRLIPQILGNVLVASEKRPKTKRRKKFLIKNYDPKNGLKIELLGEGESERVGRVVKYL